MSIKNNHKKIDDRIHQRYWGNLGVGESWIFYKIDFRERYKKADKRGT